MTQSSKNHFLFRIQPLSVIFLIVSFLISFFIIGCGNGNSKEELTCSPAQLESDMDVLLAQTPSKVDFSFAVERDDGRRYTYTRGTSTLATSYASASTSKLVSAVIILRLVEQGDLNLTDHPQQWIENWPIPSSDPLYVLTLAQLLSFTSGLIATPLCQSLPHADFATCVNTIAAANAGNTTAPGEEFYYAGTHLQVAGLMAIKASGLSDWQDLFAAFQAQTGLFPTAAYDLPSASNPRLAGGMHWTAEEYMAFLKALKKGALLNAASMNELLADHTASATMAYSPLFNGLGEDWHYGFGLWHECRSATYDCTPGSRVSSPGAYGAYPLWDRDNGYFGIVAMQGTLGSSTDGIAIERAVQSKVDEWAACRTSP